MIQPDNRIIIVDDEISQAKDLAIHFWENGIACKAYEYDKTFENPLTNVRIAFFDVNLEDLLPESEGLTEEEYESQLSPLYNNLGYAINTYISQNNGPYALVFWTKNENLVEGFKNYIDDPNRGYSDELAKPLFIGCISKEEVDKNTILEKLDEIFDDEKIKFLLEFEDNTKLAGATALNKVDEIIPKGSKWSDSTDYFENMDTILSKISMNVLGYDFAKLKPIQGVYEGLSEIVLNELLKLNPSVDPDKIVSTLLYQPKKLIKFPSDDIASKLNSVYHISEGKFEKDHRGVVLEIDQSSKSNLDRLKIDNINDWLKKLLSIKENKIELIDKVDNSFKLIALEISSACDFSQKSPRLNRYLVGVQIPKLDIRKDINTKGLPLSSYNLNGCSFKLDDFEFQLWFNFNYVFSAEISNPLLGPPLFSLNKEIMDLLGTKYANHISRIGITSF